MTLPNVGYHLARFYGSVVRRFYGWLLPVIVRRRVHAPGSLDFDVFAYSGQAGLPEQVASIRSFLRYAGRPRNYIVVSDGSYSKRSIQLLERIDPAVSVEQIPAASFKASGRLGRYFETHPTGKQLGLIMNLPREVPALYADSDVLFFEGASELVKRAGDRDVAAYYLADCRFSGDDRLLQGVAEQQNPANTGVLLLFKPLDWTLSIERFAAMEGDPTFFTNQTMTHLTMHRNAARALDPERFVLQLDDQFAFRDRYASAKLALRHYVNPVRHKFWTSLTK